MALITYLLFEESAGATSFVDAQGHRDFVGVSGVVTDGAGSLVTNGAGYAANATDSTTYGDAIDAENFAFELEFEVNGATGNENPVFSTHAKADQVNSLCLFRYPFNGNLLLSIAKHTAPTTYENFNLGALALNTATKVLVTVNAGVVNVWRDDVQVVTNGSYTVALAYGLRIYLGEGRVWSNARSSESTINYFKFWNSADDPFASAEYAIEPDLSSLAASEGDTVQYTITATGVSDGTELAISIAGDSSSAEGADFDEFGSTYESVTITGGVGTFSLTIRNDMVLEGTEDIVLYLWDAAWPDQTEVVATSTPLTITDTSTGEGFAYELTIDNGIYQSETSSYIFSEGDTLNATLTVTGGTPEPGALVWDFTGDFGVADVDAHGGALAFDSSGVASISVTFEPDSTTEGTETGNIVVNSGFGTGPAVITSDNIVVLDTSQALPSYSFSYSGISTRDEGDTVGYFFTGTTVPVGAVLYWKFADGSTITGDDVVGGQTSGSFTVDSGDIITSFGSFEITFVEDSLTEGAEDVTLELYTDSGFTNLVDTTALLTIADTSLTPPVFTIELNKTVVGEGGSVTAFITAEWFTGSTLYYDTSGTASAGDFSGASSGEIVLTENSYPIKTGDVTLNIAQDQSIEGPETFVIRLYTGSVGGTLVETSATITIADEVYTVAVNKRIVTEGNDVVFTITGQNSNPSETFDWEIVGSVSTDDFTDGLLSGTISLSGGTATLTKTLLADSTIDGAEHFYLLLKRSGGATLATSPAVLVRDAYIDFDDWLDDLSARRIVLVEMQHSAGWVYFSNVPYVSFPGDTNPNRPYDNVLADLIDIEQRMDGALTLGEIAVINNGEYNDWLGYDWRGFTVRILMGQKNWSLDDFRLVALCVNGGLQTMERGRLAWDIYDGKARFNKPLQTQYLSDGNPVPISIGKPFNVPAVLIDQPSHRYQVHESAIISVDPRDNGDAVASTDTLASGYFELTANPAGNVAADVVTAFDTPALAVSWICDRFNETADADTIADLPAYDIGLWYSTQATGGDVLQQVAQSIGGFWLVGLDGEVEIYQFTEPAATADLVLGAEDVVLGGLRLIGTEDPYKSIIFNYKRNFSPVTRDSIAGSVITGDPDFAEELTKEWRQVVVENASSEYPLAEVLEINSYLTDSANASTECNRVAGLYDTRWERWQVECFASFARAKVGNTVEITNPRHGFDTGRKGLIVAVGLALTRNRVVLEVMIPEERS